VRRDRAELRPGHGEWMAWNLRGRVEV
jgi:hypothetical protein